MALLADPGMRWASATAGGVAGVALQLQQPALCAPALYAALALAGLLLVVPPLRGWPAAPAARAALAVAALALLGFGSTGWRAGERLAGALNPALEGPDIEVIGTVSGLPRRGPTGLRFPFEVETAQRDGQPVTVPARLSLGWSASGEPEALLAGPGPELRAGQRWLFTVRLRAPHGSLNPHGFDFELWMFEQGLGASGGVRAARLLQDDAAHPVQRLRQALRDRIEAQVADPAAAGVLAALAIGDQAAITREDWDLFRRTGVAHLMAISGLHVTMFAWLAGAAIGRLWRLSGRWMLRLPAPQAARWGGLAAAAGYALLAGWGVPAQRTVWMIAVVVLLRSAGLRWPALWVLGSAGAVVAAVDPWALLQPGFWLSFAAVALLMVAAPAAREVETGAATLAPDSMAVPSPAATRGARLRAALRSGLHTQWVATVGLAPLTLIFFQQLSLVGFAANLLAIPLVTLLITPLALLGVLLPLLWAPSAWALQGLSAVLGVLAGWPWAVWHAAAAPAWAAAAGLLGGALLVLRLPWSLRALGLPLMLPLLWPLPPRPAEGRFEAVAADIGQGTAVLVRTRRHLLLYDSGPAYGPETDAGERVLLPLLHARGERAIDLLVLSHRDTDHVGGAASLLAGLPVRRMLSSLEDGHPLRAMPPPQQRCDAGQSWAWDGVRFEVLHPDAADHARGQRPNALSCVLRIADTDGRSLLLVGDIEAPQEAALLERRRERLPSTLLLVPHHGSRTSSTGAFLDAVAPQTAVVQAGYRNRFGHPAPDVLARYAARGITVVRSDECGAYTRAEDGSGFCERRRAARYWHHRQP